MKICCAPDCNKSRWLFILVLFANIVFFGAGNINAVDIAPLNWTPRPEWINIKTDPRVSPHAVGDGVADDTAAIQSAFDLMNHNGYVRGTIYFPAGTYKISTTLQISVTNYRLVGCGLNTVIKWNGPAGGAMIWPNGGSSCEYLGFVWDGNNTAGCAFLEYSNNGLNGSSNYMTGIRHEDESFRNFTSNGTYTAPDPNGIYPNGFPSSAIISGFDNPNGASPVGEVTILNCRFYNCTVAIFNPVEIFNNFMWVVDGCEFDNNGTGFTGTQSAGGGADYVFLNSHFQGSTVTDIGLGWGLRGQRLTSSGSAQFFNGMAGGTGFQDCWIDGWTNSSAAMQMNGSGQGSVVDCTFTNPPLGASRPIETSGYGMELMLSNNKGPSFPPDLGFPPGEGLLGELYGTPVVDWIPGGSMGGNITSPTQTFLKSTYPADATQILDVTAAPYNVNPNDLTTDSTAGIRAAINDAIAANNGTCVYIPFGKYKITSTLALTGGNYSIEGEGYFSDLLWYGGSNATEMTVSNPQNVTIRNIHLSLLDNIPSWGTPGYNSSYPSSDSSTSTCLKETASGPSSIVYDNLACDDFGWGNPEASWTAGFDKGLVLSGLPAGSLVYIPFLGSALTVNDCAAAQIFSLKANMGGVTVSGATQPKTGFLGLMVAEGGQSAGRSGTPTSLYNFTVTDNQNLLVGPYYSEQCYNDLDLEQGAGTTPGHVAIDGLLTAPTPQSTSINVNDYLGRLFYAQQTFSGGATNPGVQITQSGSNPFDMILAEDFFDGAGPAIDLDSGVNFVAALPMYGGVNGMPVVPMADYPTPLSTANTVSIAQGFDDFRQLGALNLAVEYGQVDSTGLVAYWKLDEPAGPSADSTMSGITGTWQNGPVFSPDHPDAIPYADAGSLSFNGVNQSVSMGNPAVIPSGHAPRTICGWAKASSTSGGYLFFASFGTNTYGNGMFLGMNGTTLYAGAGQGDDLAFPNFWDNNWHFIALTYDGTTANLYADGLLRTSALKSDWNLIPSACYVGCQADHTQFWPGAVDDVRIYNYALTPDEISNLAGTAPQGVSLITGVTAASTSANEEGNPGFTASNNSLVAGPSGILGASDSMGDSGFNPGDASDFGNFVTDLSGANITYDLGSAHNVKDLLIWNFSQSGFTSAGANSVTILSSTDNVNFTTVGTYTFNEVTQDPGYGSPRSVTGNNPPHPTGGAANVPAQVLPVNIPNARYIKLVINSNYGFSGGLVGINEVNFLGTTGAPTFDLANDFNASSDSASNTWAYGTYSDGSTPGTFNIPGSAAYSTTIPGLGVWKFPPAAPAEQSDPSIEKNLTSAPISSGGVDWLPGSVSFGPSQGPAVARFTAPTTGIYNIYAVFETDQIRSGADDGTTAYVYVGNTLEYSQSLTDPGTAQFGTAESFAANDVNLTAGETVDFVVGGGAFTTQVGATITEVVAPTLSLPSGNYSSTQTLTVNASNGEQVYYTTDGSTPTTSSNLYTGPLSIANSETVKVQAFVNGNALGNVLSATYSFPSIVPPNGLVAWYGADTGITSDASGNVSGVADQASAYQLTQSGSGQQPTLVANDCNGEPALRFSGGQSLANTSRFNRDLNADMTIITAGMSTNPDAQTYALYLGQNGAAGRNRAFCYSGSEIFDGQYAFAAGGPAANAGQFVVEAATLDSSLTHVSFYQGGALVSAGTVQGSLQPLSSGITMGAAPPGVAGWQGDILEQLVYNRKLSPPELQQVNLYLANKYALYNAGATWVQNPAYSDFAGYPAFIASAHLSKSQADAYNELDPSGSGLPVWWEMEYFNQSGLEASSSLDGNGLTLLQDYQQGNDPTNYYSQGGQAIVPTFSITGGNNQTGPPNQLLPSPIAVHLETQAGAPLVNAPVVFNVTIGSGELATTALGVGAATQTATTDSGGNAQIYFQQPNSPEFHSSILVKAGTQSVTVVESTTLDGTTPAGFMYESWGATDSNGDTISIPFLVAGSFAAQYKNIAPTGLTVPSHTVPGFAEASGWLVPTQSGSHVLTLNGTNNAKLYLSTDKTRDNEQLVASVTNGSQTTSAVTLTANTQYYFEVYLQTTQSSDQASVGWTEPDGTVVPVIPVEDLAPSVNAGGVPLDGLTAWYGADSGVTADGSGNVTALADQASDFQLTPRGGQPTLIANDSNGEPGLRFNGNQSLSNNDRSNSDLNADMTIVTAGMSTNPNAQTYALYFGQNAVAGQNRAFCYIGSEFFDGQFIYAEGARAARAGQFVVEAATLDSSLTHVSFYQGGALVSSSTMLGALQTVSPAVTMGAAFPGVAGWQGDILEQLVYNHKLSATELQQVNLYLANKYALYNADAAWVQNPVYSTSPAFPAFLASAHLSKNQADAYNQMDPSDNGLPVWWEEEYFNQSAMDASSSPNGNGLTLLQDYQQGNDPTNYYSQGGQIITPVLSIASGDDQTGSPGELLGTPITVHVQTQSGTALANAPVTFSVAAGAGQIALNALDVGTAAQATTTDASGNAQIYFQQPNTNTFHSSISVQAGTQTALIVASTNLDATSPAGFMYESWGATDPTIGTISLSSLISGSVPAQYRNIDQTTLTLPANAATGFAKASGWLVPSQTGSHVLTLNGTNSAKLYLSTDGTAANKQLVASVVNGTQSTSAVTLTADTQYFFEVYLQVTQSTDQATVGWTEPDGTVVPVIPVEDLAPNVNAGGVLWEFWNDIDDQALSYLLSSKWYPDEPVTRSLTSATYSGNPVPASNTPLFEMYLANPNYQNTGSRLQGYVLAPQTGSYHFWVAGDDECQFLISPSTDPSLAVPVAAVPNGSFTPVRAWTYLAAGGSNPQESATVTLQAGHWYYVEGFEKNGHGAGDFSLGWTLPDGTFEGPIPAWHFNPIPGKRLGNMPTVRFASPVDGGSYVEGDAIQVVATIASPDSAITLANLLVDGTLVGPLTGPSYAASIPYLTPGNHKITVQVSDGLSEQAHDDANIYVFPSYDAGSDGLSSYEQATETYTDPSSGKVTGLTTDFTINGSGFSNLSASSDWIQSGNSLVSNSVQGWAEYQTNITTPNIYRMVIQGSAITNSSGVPFSLGVMIDGVLTDTVLLPAGTVSLPDQAVSYTPWLTAGTHTIRLVWTNYTMGNVISINGLLLQEVNGPSTNPSGTEDWVQSRFQNQDAISVAPTNSQVSPECIEGTVQTLGDMTISNNVVPMHGVASNWYANVPLSATQSTSVTVSFENGAYQQQKTLTWTPTNLLQGGNTTIRQGDSLLLTAVDSANTSSVPVTIQVPGQSAINTTNSQPTAVQFNQAGTFTVTGSYYAAYPQGDSYNSSTGTPFSYTVTVVAADFGGNVLAWNARTRIWNCPNIPASVDVDSDPAITFSKTASQPITGSQFSLLTTNPVDSYVVARLAPGGPILANAAVRGFWLMSSDQTNLNTVQTYPDGSVAVEMDVVSSLVTPDMNIVLQINNDSSLFPNGTINQTLTAADFDGHNATQVYFIVSPGGNSICHSLTVYQGSAYVGTR